ncbi:hypothetical protein KC332_g13322 [Hortaea werneckii]|uniref:GrpE protein homolog, mitochondrial n=1 Tax=Hortaea werneckii TaxID=91943 RepID=A0A3M7HWN2_HORWE|nr:hypothetical protein KC358_g8954 [Hortaea werneckii]KAI6855217.1 hypothetical protein KC338_g8948 [Hortaea werneckii]KAI6862168.1 hypothetical protein KC323_g5578 [Hortaea werneckii]KAI6909983.1 hypothetical protein KC348_g13358 [Hortaea werneckii]KAI6926111.1 hypothetical protein KC341_g12983 [Hortaea werneckii]
MIQRTFLRSLQTATRQQQPIRRAMSTSPFTAQRAAAPLTSQRLGSQRRWQSQEAEKKKDESGEQNSGDKAASEAGKEAENPLQKELDSKNREVIDLTDRVKRTAADFRNLQEQTKREVKASKDYALQRFAKDLLDSVDNLDRALSVVPAEKLNADANKDLVDLHSGLKMTETILMQTLKKHGIERFDPAENTEKFDANTMEATFMAPQQGKEDGTVFYTQSKGFLLNGRVLRAPKVGVVKNS